MKKGISVRKLHRDLRLSLRHGADTLAALLFFLVTASLLPIEIYEIVNRLSPLKILAFVINVAVVTYLLLAKRLFGLRGGARADEQARAIDVGWEALERTAPAAAPARQSGRSA